MKIRVLVRCVVFLLLGRVNHGFQQSRRRRFLFLSVAPFFCPPSDATADVLRAKECVQGQGDGCLEYSEESEFIRSLQEKSSTNRERNEQEAKDAFYMKNYPDWFATVGKIMVKKSDGSFMIVDALEAEQLQKEGRLGYETARTKGGKLIDYTQKPILVLRD